MPHGANRRSCIRLITKIAFLFALICRYFCGRCINVSIHLGWANSINTWSSVPFTVGTITLLFLLRRLSSTTLSHMTGRLLLFNSWRLKTLCLLSILIVLRVLPERAFLIDVSIVATTALIGLVSHGQPWRLSIITYITFSLF